MGPATETVDRCVVVLNGPAGVGKTTVGRRLAATARNGVCVHGDDLKRFVVARDPATVEQGLSYVGGAALADVFLDAGYDLVVFEFVFERRAHVDRFLGGLRSDVAVHLVTLWAPLEVVMARELARLGREPLGARVSTCWNAMVGCLDELGSIVDARPSVDAVLAETQRCVAAGGDPRDLLRLRPAASPLGGHPVGRGGLAAGEDQGSNRHAEEPDERVAETRSQREVAVAEGGCDCLPADADY